MSEWDRQQQGYRCEGYAFTFCKAAFLVLIFQKYALFALSGLATLFYILAAMKGVRTWRCWAKPPWVTLFWTGIFAWQCWLLFLKPHSPAVRGIPFHAAAQQSPRTATIAARWQEALGAQRNTETPISSPAPRQLQAGMGTVLIAGGGVTSPELVKTFIAVAGGPDAPILILPQTEADPIAGGPESVALFRENGARQVEALVGLPPEEVCRRLQTAQGVWIPGGDQNRFMTIYPETSGVPAAIRQVFRRGGIVGGTSAGASLMGAKMPTGAPTETQGLQTGGCLVAPGLNLLPNTIVDQHFFARNRMQRLLTAVLDNPGYHGLGIEQGGWLVIRNGIHRAQTRQTLAIRAVGRVRHQQGYFGADNIHLRLLLPGDQTRF